MVGRAGLQHPGRHPTETLESLVLSGLGCQRGVGKCGTGRCNTAPGTIPTPAAWLLVALGVVGLLLEAVALHMPFLVAVVAHDRLLVPRLLGSRFRKRLQLDASRRRPLPSAGPPLRREQLGAHFGEVSLPVYVLQDGLDHVVICSKTRQDLQHKCDLVHLVAQHGEFLAGALGSRRVLDDVLVAVLLEVAQLVHGLQQPCVVTRLTDVLERVSRVLGRTDRRRRMEINRLDRHLDGRQRPLVHDDQRVRHQVAFRITPGGGAVRHYCRPDLLLDKLCTTVHGSDLVIVVQLRKARATVAPGLRLDDDNRAPRRNTDDVGGLARPPDAGTHSSPSSVVPQMTERKTTMTTNDTGPITCEVGDVDWVRCFTRHGVPTPAKACRISPRPPQPQGLPRHPQWRG